MEVAGLVIGIAGLAGLFSTCLETFNIAVTARDFGHDFEVLMADLDLQRLRFYLWGDALGLIGHDSSRPPARMAGLEDPQVEATIKNALQSILFLLRETGRMRDRFIRPFSSYRSLEIFQAAIPSFEQKAQAVRRGNSRAAVTRWAFHSKDQFKEKLERLKSLIEGLENVSASLGVLQAQRQRMRAEIESLEDVASLRLVMDAAASDQQELSDAASVRILAISEGSTHETAATQSIADTFYTAPGHALPSQPPALLDRPLVASYSTDVDTPSDGLAHLSLGWHREEEVVKPRKSVWKIGPKTDRYGSKLASFDIDTLASTNVFPPSLSFVQDALATFDITDAIWGSHASGMGGSAAKKRMLKDIERYRTIRGLERWYAYAPVSDSLYHLLAAIEGPPDTPYEDGVFWIEIWIPNDFPFKAPKLRLLTRIYHPNIDAKGRVCFDILGDAWFPSYKMADVLVSLCSILDDPGLEDPLVPEIAEVYRRDFELYCRNAKEYTARYACASVDDAG